MDGPLKLRHASHSAGNVAIEYGLILPAMLLFIFGLMDASRLLWTNITLTRATEAAARCGAVNTTTCPTASIPAYAATQAQNFGLYDAVAADFVVSTSVSCGVQGQVTGVQVTATYTFKFVVPWFPQFSASAPFGSTTLTLNSTSCYQ